MKSIFRNKAAITSLALLFINLGEAILGRRSLRGTGFKLLTPFFYIGVRADREQEEINLHNLSEHIYEINNGKTVFHKAIDNNNEAILACLRNFPLDINWGAKKEQAFEAKIEPLLHYAIRQEKINIAKYLRYSVGVSGYLTDNKGVAAFELVKEDELFKQYLFYDFIKENFRAFKEAIKSHNQEIVDFYLAKNFSDLKLEFGDTIAHYAIRHNYLNLPAKLIKKFLYKINSKGEILLDISNQNSFVLIKHYIIENIIELIEEDNYKKLNKLDSSHKYDFINTKIIDGLPVISYVIIRDKKNIFNFYIKPLSNRINFSQISSENLFPLDYAVKHQRFDFLENLLERRFMNSGFDFIQDEALNIIPDLLNYKKEILVNFQEAYGFLLGFKKINSTQELFIESQKYGENILKHNLDITSDLQDFIINLYLNNKRTAIRDAIQNKNKAEIIFFLERNLNPLYFEYAGNTVISHCYRESHYEFLELFAEKNKQEVTTEIVKAAFSKSNFKLIDYVITSFSYSSFESYLPEKIIGINNDNDSKNIALEIREVFFKKFIKKFNLKAENYLKNKGEQLDLTIQAQNGQNLLHILLQENREICYNFLIENAVLDPFKRDNSGKIPVFYADPNSDVKIEFNKKYKEVFGNYIEYQNIGISILVTTLITLVTHALNRNIINQAEIDAFVIDRGANVVGG